MSNNIKPRPGGLWSAMLLLTVALATGAATAAVNTPPADNNYSTAGDSVTNTVELDYEVGGVAQTQITDSETFTVDRRVAVDVIEYDNATSGVSPGQALLADFYVTGTTGWLVTNTSNDSIDVALAAVNRATASADPHGGANDSFDTGAFTYYADDGDNVFDAGDTGASITHLNALAADATVLVWVVPASIGTEDSGETAVVRLTGAARTNDGAATLGAAFADDEGNADVLGGAAQNVLEQASDFDDDSFTIATAIMSISKASTVLSDPINGASADAKRIPGATIRYTIVVANDATGTAPADVVTINDTLDNAYFDTGGTVTLYFDENDDGDCDDLGEASHASTSYADPTATFDVDAAEAAATAGTDANGELDPGEDLEFCIDVDIL